MPRKAQPFHRKQDDWWYVTVRQGGKRRQIKLIKGIGKRDEAFRRFHALMASVPSDSQTRRPNADRFRDVANLFLADMLAEKGDAHHTYRWYAQFLESFSAFVDSDLRVDGLRPFHVTQWLATKSWPRDSGTRNSAVRAIKRSLRWAQQQGHIATDPLAAMKCPPKASRDATVSPQDFEKLLATASDVSFRDLLMFLAHTGCRPQEAFTADAVNFEPEHRRIVLPRLQSKGKRSPRVIYLDDVATEIVVRRIANQGGGPILRNTRGLRWTAHTVYRRFARRDQQMGRRICAYLLRHGYATEGLKRGIDSTALAVLMGHSDASTIARVYQHLAKDPAFLSGQAAKMMSDPVLPPSPLPEHPSSPAAHQ